MPVGTPLARMLSGRWLGNYDVVSAGVSPPPLRRMQSAGWWPRWGRGWWLWALGPARRGPGTRRQTSCRERYAKGHRVLLQPCLSWVSFDLRAVLERLRRERVAVCRREVTIFFVVQEPLACITTAEAMAEIRIHPLLNSPETPLLVFQHVLTHELLHLVVPPRVIDGKRVVHPPEFFEEERTLAPEWHDSSNWIRGNFYRYLKDDKKRQCVLVRKRWEEAMYRPRFGIEMFRTAVPNLVL